MGAPPNATHLVRFAWGAACLVALASTTQAAVTDVTPTDVTTRAFSVVWASDEPVTAATVRVFDDAAGTTEITSSLAISQATPAAALGLGIVKVDVTGLAPDTCYYFQTETTGGAMVQSPAAPPFTEVCSAVSTSKADVSEVPIVNDLIADNLYAPDGVSEGDGTLMVVSLPGVGEYPVSSFAGEVVPLTAAAIDLSNVFDAVSGGSARPATGDVMLIRQFRGLLCADLADHVIVRYRRVPAHGEVSTLGQPIVELETGDPCFFADTECDDTVDILDVQRVLNVFDSQSGECAFNVDLDIVPDQRIDILDVQSVLNRFGESAPFN